MKIIIRITLLISVLLILSCKNDDNSNFDIEGQVENIFDNGIIAQIDILTSDAQIFYDVALDFQENNTIENFEKLQNSWKSLMLNWKPLESLTVGTVTLKSKIDVIDFWPIENQEIDDSIEQNEIVIDLTTVQKLGGRSKGLAAVEYLLFSKYFESYTTNEYAENYKLFLLGLSEDLVNEIQDYKSIWLDNEEIFKNSLENSVSGTQNEIVNSIIFKINELSTTKIGLPLGIETGVVDPSLTEAKYSEFSLDIIKKEIEQVENVFTGLYTDNAIENGLYAQLESLGRGDLVGELISDFETIYSVLDNIDLSLEEQLITNTTVLFELKDAMTELEILIKNDTASALNIIITFSDNDGD